LIEDHWLGTKPGCYCPKENKLEADYCNNMVDNLIEFFKGADDCKDVEPLEP